MFGVLYAIEIYAQQAERKRFEALSLEQQAAELRYREVRALEDIARAQQQIAQNPPKFSIF
jgi:hypothetical protein